MFTERKEPKSKVKLMMHSPLEAVSDQKQIMTMNEKAFMNNNNSHQNLALPKELTVQNVDETDDIDQSSMNEIKLPGPSFPEVSSLQPNTSH